MTWCTSACTAAVATSAALGFPIALANTVGYIVGGWSLNNPMSGSLGYLWLPALAVIASASVLFAPLGARAAHAMNVGQLKRVFAGMLYCWRRTCCSRAFESMTRRYESRRGRESTIGATSVRDGPGLPPGRLDGLRLSYAASNRMLASVT
jgi:hypothetical protein